MITIIIFSQSRQRVLSGHAEPRSQRVDIGRHLTFKFFISYAADTGIIITHTHVDHVVQLAENTHLRKLGYPCKKHKTKIGFAILQRAVEIAHHVAQQRQFLILMHHVEQRRIILIDQDNDLTLRLVECCHYEC